MHQFKLFLFSHSLRYHHVFGIEWKNRKCPWYWSIIVWLNLAWQWRYPTDNMGFLFIGTHCILCDQFVSNTLECIQWAIYRPTLIDLLPNLKFLKFVQHWQTCRSCIFNIIIISYYYLFVVVGGRGFSKTLVQCSTAYCFSFCFSNSD